MLCFFIQKRTNSDIYGGVPMRTYAFLYQTIGFGDILENYCLIISEQTVCLKGYKDLTFGYRNSLERMLWDFQHDWIVIVIFDTGLY